MRTKASKVRALLYALTFAVFALLFSATASAQTTRTTETNATAIAVDPAPTQSPDKVVAPVDSTNDSSFGLGSGVSGIGTDDAGNAYIALQFQDMVVKVDGGGMALAKIPVGKNPVGVIVDSLNKVFYTLNNGDNTVSKAGLDGTPIATFKVDGDGPLNGVKRGDELIFTCERSSTVVRMSTAGVQLSSTPVGSRPVWVAASAGKLGEIYVSCNKANQVWKLSSAGEAVAKYDTGRGPYGIVLNVNGDFLVACSWDAVVLRHSGSTGVILSKTGVADGPSQMVAYNDAVAVVSIGGNRVTRLSAVDGLMRSSEVVNRSPSTIAAGLSLWVGCDGSGTVTRRAL